MVIWHAKVFISELVNMNKKLNDEHRIEFIRNKPAPRHSDPLDCIWCDIIPEVRVTNDGSWEFLQTFRKLEIPPEWLPLQNLAGGSIHKLIDDLKDDYYRAAGKLKH